jgi:hypothetical protein
MRITYFKEYLQKDMENDECFHRDVMGKNLDKISSLSDIHIREQNLPYNICMKQINAC